MTHLIEVIGWEEEEKVEMVMVTGGWGGWARVMGEGGMEETQVGAVEIEETEKTGDGEVLALTPQTRGE